MADELRVFLRQGREWDRLVERLASADERFVRLTQDTTLHIAIDAEARVKAKVLAMPTHGKKHRGRRKQVAAGVGKRRTRWGYRITSSMPSPQLAFYPRAIMSKWMHPTYGHRPEDVQIENWDWFYGPIRSLYDNFEHQLHDDMEDMARYIAGR